MTTSPEKACDPSRRISRKNSAGRQWQRRCLALASLLLFPVVADAQIPAGAIGRIEGDDISVKGTAGIVSERYPHSIFLASGSEVSVRSGQAHIELPGGGEISICGPASFTLLESSGAFTLALNFGRLHLHLEDSMPFTIFSPQIVAAPMALNGKTRDATLGLDFEGALCVLASSGAVRLEQQLSGENILVPQPSEVSLGAGQSKAVPVAAGTCRCDLLEVHAKPLLPPHAEVPPEVTLAPLANPPAPSAGASPPVKQQPAPALEFSVPAQASNVHPVAPPERKIDPEPPATAPTWKVMMPPLAFDATSPSPPPDPGPQPILLIREARVEPEWVFRGRVEPRAKSARPLTATTQPRATSPPPVNRAAVKSASAPKKKQGFWSRLRDFFRGGGPKPAG